MFGLTTLRRGIQRVFHKAEPMRDEAGWTIFGSDIPSSWNMGWWQQGLSGSKSAHDNTAVESCVSQYARTIAMLPIRHTRDLPDGGRAPVKNSNVARLLRRPNGYQTRADFFMNLVRAELLTGNAYAAAIRDPDQFQITQLHLLPPTGTRHYVDSVDQEIFYQVGGNTLSGLNEAMLLPARDVLHVRMQTEGNDPLRGVTPLASGLLAAKAGTAIQGHNASFFNNMSRPSGTLNTDLELEPEQTAALRKRWEQQSAGLNSGKTPILSHGLKWQPLAMTATDAEMIEFYKLTVADIARVYGIPQALVGIMDASTFSNVEALLNMWVSTALGYMVDHIELSLEILFDLPPEEHINFDLDYLLRGAFETRMAALNKGILGGVYSINEARAKEGLKPVEEGDQPRVQMQVVPLTHHDEELQLKKDRLDLDREIAENDDTEEEAPPPDDDEKTVVAITAIRKAMR